MAFNFSDTLPAAPSGHVNMAWQQDLSGNVSANVPIAATPAPAIQQETYVYSADTGAANAYAVTLTPAPVIVAGSKAVFPAAHANTGASTLAVNGAAAIAILKQGTLPLAGGEIAAGQMVTAIFDGTSYQLEQLGGGLRSAANLSDVASAATSRTNLGLGTAATTAATAYDASGAATAAQAAAILASCQRASNLSDVASAATARTNLGLTAAAIATPAALTELTSAVLTITGGSAALLAACSITVQKATASVPGYLAAADFTTFAAKQAALTPAALTEATSSVLTITGGSAALLAATSIQVKLATSTVNGYLAATDWVIFNAKQAALGFTPASLTVNTFSGIQTFTVAPVFTDAPNTRIALGLGAAALLATPIPIASGGTGAATLLAANIAALNAATNAFTGNATIAGTLGVGIASPSMKLGLDNGAATLVCLGFYQATVERCIVGLAGSTNQVFIGALAGDATIRASTGSLLLGANNGSVAAALTINQSGNTAIAGALGVTGAVSLTAKIGTYNSIATVANGVGAIVAQTNLTAQAASIGATTLYAVPASGAGLYRVSSYLVVTQAATTSSTMPACGISYTDESGTVHADGWIGTTSTANVLGTNSQTTTPPPMSFYAKASTNIQYQTDSYASVGATPMQYALRIRVEFLG